MERHFTFFRVLKRLLLALIPVALIGGMFGFLFEALAVFLFVVAVWNIFYQQRLNRWLWLSRTMHPPQAPGAWSDIYDGIYRTLRRTQTRRRSLALILQRFREAAESIPDGGLVIESDGRLMWSNKLAQLYFGLKWPNDKGLRITSLIRHPRFIRYFKRGDFREPITLSSPTGENREIELRIMPYAHDQLLVIVRDVTRIIRLERMRKDFVANVSHELKTPLTVMQGYLELMEEPEALPPQQLKKAIHDISSQTRRMQLMVEQLLLLSRIESQGMEAANQPVHIATLVRSLISDVSLMLESKQQKLHARLDEEVWIVGNEEKLRAAFHNLVVNAIKYTQEQGEIEVEISHKGGRAYCEVADNGPGIAREHLPRLTERFYRVDEARSSDSGGTGLGLSIVKHALEYHRSQLHIDSVLGKGSRFSFILPVELTLIRPVSAPETVTSEVAEPVTKKS